MTAQPEPIPAETRRPRGRPRLDIDRDAVADAVAELFAEGGIDAVSILDTAEKLSVSRATLYRTVPTREHLLGILFERSTSELTKTARAAVKETADPGERLVALVQVHIDAAIRMRRYMPVFFGGGDLPPDVLTRWQRWSREYETIWVRVVKENIDAGLLPKAEPVVTARLILGSCIWVSRWYRPKDKYDGESITETAVNLVRAMQGGRPDGVAPRPRTATTRNRSGGTTQP